MIDLKNIADSGTLIYPGTFRYTLYPACTEPFSLCYADNEKFLEQAITNPNISCIITTEENAEKVPYSKGLITTIDPQALYYAIHNKLVQEKKGATR